MREITKQMVKIYNIKQFDFMGYDIKRKESLSFHHLIVAKRNCHKERIGNGYYIWNGAILVQDTSHNYLHLIEHYDYEIFYRITSEMIDQNVKGRLDIENLRQIKDLLLYFEQEYEHEKSKKNKLLIKRDYLENRFNWGK